MYGIMYIVQGTANCATKLPCQDVGSKTRSVRTQHSNQTHGSYYTRTSRCHDQQGNSRFVAVTRESICTLTEELKKGEGGREEGGREGEYIL